MTADSNAPAGSRTIKASAFKARCLRLMDEVAKSGEEVIITKNGRPVSRLMPYRPRPQAPFGRDRDKTSILGDITSPTDAAWEAETNPHCVLNP